VRHKPSIVKTVLVFVVASIAIQAALQAVGVGPGSGVGFYGGILCAIGYFAGRRQQYKAAERRAILRDQALSVQNTAAPSS
jgi:hypothetical protein